ncbi:hypothetical protein NDU88_009751 [Pleurodeles waltl]|uniref:Uncharacterized protein n=1 Tax=Pleurodeles waltl TaxID=8319 RepID=A0AAV7PU40_PLEWA|nr:hypothetical protein NDU88_009751 [Pleurodeles waltl]
MKTEVEQDAAGADGEEDEEEEDAETEEEIAKGGDAGERNSDIGEEEPQDEGLGNSRGDPTEGQGSPEKEQLCHVPGGVWLQQVRSCLKHKIRAILGREEGGEGE